METAINNTSSLSWTSAPFEALKLKLAQRRQYRNTVEELSSLSDRSLADLGLSRSMINQIARETAYDV